jgi:hypothetical protein
VLTRAEKLSSTYKSQLKNQVYKMQAVHGTPRDVAVKGTVPTTSVNVEKKPPTVAQVVNAPVAKILNIQIWIFPLILDLLTLAETDYQSQCNTTNFKKV